MFDRVTEEARAVSEWLEEPGLLMGLYWIRDNIEQYDEDFQEEFHKFMLMGQKMFAPAEA